MEVRFKSSKMKWQKKSEKSPSEQRIFSKLNSAEELIVWTVSVQILSKTGQQISKEALTQKHDDHRPFMKWKERGRWLISHDIKNLQ